MSSPEAKPVKLIPHAPTWHIQVTEIHLHGQHQFTGLTAQHSATHAAHKAFAGIMHFHLTDGHD